MTALKKYQKLQCLGLWRDAADAQRREVVVNFGEASLILSDPRTDVAVSHWSLPAVERLNPDQLPAVFAPDPDARETLELDDTEMIAALAKVHSAIEHARARPGRLRLVVLLGSVVLFVGLLAGIGPGQLVRHTATMVPEGVRNQIGQLALADMARITGQPCDGGGGQQVLDRLAFRLFGPGQPWSLRILPDGVPGAAQLPGHLIVLDRALVENQTGPEALAGQVLAESLRALQADPLEPVLHHAGLSATLGLMTSGRLATDQIAGYGEALLRQLPTPLDDAALIESFRLSGVPSSAYGYAVDPSGETTLTLIEADPYRGTTPDALMTPEDWAILQRICR